MRCLLGRVHFGSSSFDLLVLVFTTHWGVIVCLIWQLEGLLHKLVFYRIKSFFTILDLFLVGFSDFHVLTHHLFTFAIVLDCNQLLRHGCMLVSPLSQLIKFVSDRLMVVVKS